MRTIGAAATAATGSRPTAAICPGCGRRHPVRVRPLASPAMGPPTIEAVPPSARAGRRRHGPLLRTARGARWLLALTAWVASGLRRRGGGPLRRRPRRVADRAVARTCPARRRRRPHAVGLVAAARAPARGRGRRRDVVAPRPPQPAGPAPDRGPGRAPGRSAGGSCRAGGPRPSKRARRRAVARLAARSSADLPHRGWSRRPVSRVVLHWWTLWLAVPGRAACWPLSLAGGADELARRARRCSGSPAAALAVADDPRALRRRRDRHRRPGPPGRGRPAGPGRGGPVGRRRRRLVGGRPRRAGATSPRA